MLQMRRITRDEVSLWACRCMSFIGSGTDEEVGRPSDAPRRRLEKGPKGGHAK